MTLMYRMYSASAFAANTIIRSAVAASFPLFTTQMFTVVRPLSSLSPILEYIYSNSWV